MPEIRSITCFTTVNGVQDFMNPLNAAGQFLNHAKRAYEEAGIRVQSKRAATQPFPQFGSAGGVVGIPAMAGYMSEHCRVVGIDYLSIGPVTLADDPAYIDVLERVFSRTDNVFGTVAIGDYGYGIPLDRVRKTAELIKRVSQLTADGMENLYLAALANCPPWSPFFPVAYHDGGDPVFALAIQAADIANVAFANASSPEEAAQNLTAAIEDFSAQVVPIAEKLEQQYGVPFVGLDFSLAPFPTDDWSLGGALEKLGTPFGGPGLVASAALTMTAVENADFPTIGFSGLMLPILEDSVLGRRVVEDRLRINDLLLLSAICGTGLDCIPLPGDVDTDYLAALLLDVAALALRLDKPLTARLMPFPGKQAGDPLQFDFPYFCDSKVLAVPDYPLARNAALGAAAGTIEVLPRIYEDEAFEE